MCNDSHPALSPPLIFTVGHSTHTAEEFVRILKAHEVDMLVDVRKLARSGRNPQFEGARLASILGSAGISYRHLPELGGLRHPRAESRENAGMRSRFFRGFADHMATPEFKGALKEVLNLGRERRVALMCAEAAPSRCHRSMIADALVARGVPVADIVTASRTQPHQLRESARVRGGEISYPASGEDEETRVA